MGFRCGCCKFGDADRDFSEKLEEGVERASARCGQAAVAGRYHKLPKRLQDDYVLEERAVLGNGFSGTVRRAVQLGTGTPYAVKSFRTKGISRHQARMLQAEAEIYLTLDHPNVARLVDVYEDAEELSLVMECLSGGELFDRIDKLKRFSEDDTRKCVLQMLRAVNYLHSHGVVHRDLKLDNFLYEDPDSDHLKLIDFGFSQLWTPEDTTMKAFVGTLSYMAPEVLHFRASYTSQCDLWSLGVVTFILLTGHMPFSGSEGDQIRAIKVGAWRDNAPHAWHALTPCTQDFVEKLLTVDPNLRMTASEALRHAFIKEGPGSGISARLRARSMSSHAMVEPDVAQALVKYAQASQLRRAIVQVMAWSLSSEEQKKVRDQFVAMDKSGRGTITMEELRSALTRSGVGAELVEPVFRELNVAKDDEIHYSEFLAAMVSTRIVMHEDLLKQTFRRFDQSNTGYITLQNLKALFGDSFDGVPIEALLQEADLKKDNKISYEEFIQFLTNDGSTPAYVGRVPTDVPKASMRNAAVATIDAELDRMGSRMNSFDSGSSRAGRAPRPGITARIRSSSVVQFLFPPKGMRRIPSESSKSGTSVGASTLKNGMQLPHIEEVALGGESAESSPRQPGIPVVRETCCSAPLLWLVAPARRGPRAAPRNEAPEVRPFSPSTTEVTDLLQLRRDVRSSTM